MTKEDEFVLELKSFKDHTNTYWQKLRSDENFSDVTVACENKQVKAHRVVLSACSPVLEKILICNPHQNPLIYLKGVEYSQLINLLDFLYIGQVTIVREDLNVFLALANEFRVKGLADENEKVINQLNLLQDFQNVNEIPSSKRRKESYTFSQYTERNINYHDTKTDSVELSNQNEIKEENLISDNDKKGLVELSDESKIRNNTIQSNDNFCYDSTVKDNFYHKGEGGLEKSIDTNQDEIEDFEKNNDKENEVTETNKNINTSEEDKDVEPNNCIKNDKSVTHGFDEVKKAFSNRNKDCTLCDFKLEDTNKFEVHKQLVHGDHYFCELCDWNSKNKSRLKSHVLIVHEGFREECDECDYKTGDKSALRRHKRMVHKQGGIWYFCKDCDYSSSDTTTLKRHEREVHEAVRYPCLQCDYKGSRKAHLNRHINFKHEGTIYPCSQCNFTTGFKASLKIHDNANHANKI